MRCWGARARNRETAVNPMQQTPVARSRHRVHRLGNARALQWESARLGMPNIRSPHGTRRGAEEGDADEGDREDGSGCDLCEMHRARARSRAATRGMRYCSGVERGAMPSLGRAEGQRKESRTALCNRTEKVSCARAPGDDGTSRKGRVRRPSTAVGRQ